MKTYLKYFLIFVLSSLFLTSCSYKPIKEIEEAKTAINEAKEAEADKYSPDELKSAEEFLEKSLKEMEERKYVASKASALSSKNFAISAKEKALSRKQSIKEMGEIHPAELTASVPVVQETSVEGRPVITTGALGEGAIIPQLQRVHFDFDDYSIRNDAKEILKKNYEWLKTNPDVKIVIEGHCDERGSDEYNLALGHKRAESVKNFLINLGIDATRLTAVSFGEEVPLIPEHNENAWAQNRRVEFVIKK